MGIIREPSNVPQSWTTAQVTVTVRFVNAEKNATEVNTPNSLAADSLRPLAEIVDKNKLERRLEPGTKVRIRSGPFAGYVGTVFRREGETRLTVAVEFMDQGVSVAVEDVQLEID